MLIEIFFIGVNFEYDYGVCEVNEKILIWKDFFNYVILYGFYYIFEGRRFFWVCVIWFFFLIICIGYVVYFLCCSIIKYFDYFIVMVLCIEYFVDNMFFLVVILCLLIIIINFKVFMKDDYLLFNKLGFNIDVCKVIVVVRVGRLCGEVLLCCCVNIVISIRGVVDNCMEEYRNEFIEVLKVSDFLFNN